MIMTVKAGVIRSHSCVLHLIPTHVGRAACTAAGAGAEAASHVKDAEATGGGDA